MRKRTYAYLILTFCKVLSKLFAYIMQLLLQFLFLCVCGYSLKVNKAVNRKK